MFMDEIKGWWELLQNNPGLGRGGCGEVSLKQDWSAVGTVGSWVLAAWCLLLLLSLHCICFTFSLKKQTHTSVLKLACV